MDKITGYANYGVLGCEKEIFFTAGPVPANAITSERIEYTVPEGWDCEENAMGDQLLTAPWGTTYLPGEIICSERNTPYLFGYKNNYSIFNIKLEWEKI